MSYGQVSPAHLKGDALRRWYLRTPDEIEAERTAAAEQAYNAFSSRPNSRTASGFGDTTRGATTPASDKFSIVGDSAAFGSPQEYHPGGDEFSPRGGGQSPPIRSDGGEVARAVSAQLQPPVPATAAAKVVLSRLSGGIRRSAICNLNLTARFPGDCRVPATSQFVVEQHPSDTPIASGPTARSASPILKQEEAAAAEPIGAVAVAELGLACRNCRSTCREPKMEDGLGLDVVIDPHVHPPPNRAEAEERAQQCVRRSE